MKRFLSTTVALLTAGAMLTACGGDAKDDETTKAGETTTTATETTDAPAAEYPDLKGQTINVAADWSGGEQANFEKVLEGFEKATGADVVYTSLGNNVATALGTQIEGGKPPQVALIPQPGLMNQLAKDGSIKPLADDVLKTVNENYAQTWVDLGSYEGKTYGVWFKAANKSTMWYNTGLYEDAGVTVPTTWDEFKTALGTLSDSGVAGISIGADVGWPLTDWFENVYLRTAGPEMYDKLTNHEIPWTDPSVEVALTKLAEVWGDAKLIQADGAQRTFPDTVTAVFGDNPAAATVYEGDFVAGNIKDQTSSVVGEDAKFYAFPAIDGSKPSVMGAGNVAVAFDDSEGTMALMKYLASPEAANAWIPLGGFTSPNKAADLKLYPDATALEIATQLVEAEVFRFDMSDLVPSAFGGTEGQGMWQEFINFYKNPSDIKGAMDKLEAAAKAAYAG